MPLLLLSVLLAGPALPQEDDRVRQLETRVEAQARELEAQRRFIEELRAWLAGRTASAPSRELAGELRRLDAALGEAPLPDSGRRRPPPSGVSVGGYFTLQFVTEEGRNSTFDAVRLVPQISGEIAPDLKFSTEIEFEHGGVADFLDDGEIAIEYAELRWSLDPALAPKVGVLLIPFNRFNLVHDDPLNELNDRPFVARHVVPSAFGQPGFGVEGAFAGEGGIPLNYDLVVSNGFDEAFTTNDGSREARAPFNEDNNHDKALFARVGFVPPLPLLDAADLGASFNTGKYDNEGKRGCVGYGVDWFLRKGPLDLLGEWAAIDLERRPGDGPPALDLNGNGVLGDVPGEFDLPRGLHGLYAQANFHFLPEAWRGRRPFTEESEFTLAVRFDTSDLNDRVVGATPRDDREAWTVGINFRPVRKTAIKASYQWIRTPFDGPDDVGNAFVLGVSTYF
ncbi:MAG TPA: hypothetical protein VFI25_01410 [Planctomycetota bacterium]|jgi:hypothetical protein|nr:hypothetical protein [Planctomycetota bacterium]